MKNFTQILLLTVLSVILPGISLAQSDKAEFIPSGKVWGRAFTDVYFKAGGDTATWASRAEYSGVPAEVYAFGLRRMYLGYDYNMSRTFSAAFLLEANDGIITPKGDRSVTIKELSIKWKNIYKGADLLFGQQPTLAFKTAEEIWKYRHIEKTLTDMRGIRSSSDMGIALKGKLHSERYGYNLMIGNGTATRPEDLTSSGKHKIYSAEVYGWLIDSVIMLNVYGDYQTGLNERTLSTLKGFVAYQSDPFTLGVEVLTHTQAHIKSDNTDISPIGFSVFARGRIIPGKLNAFVRYDSFNPDNNYRTEDVLPAYNASNMFRHYDETFFTAGLDFVVLNKKVHIIPNIWINSYSPKADSDILVEREADIVPRLTIYFNTKD